MTSSKKIIPEKANTTAVAATDKEQQEGLEKKEYRQDKRALDSETLHERRVFQD